MAKKRNSEKLTGVYTLLEERQGETLDFLSFMQRRSKADLIREALDEFMKRELKKYPKEYRVFMKVHGR